MLFTDYFNLGFIFLLFWFLIQNKEYEKTNYYLKIKSKSIFFTEDLESNTIMKFKKKIEDSAEK